MGAKILWLSDNKPEQYGTSDPAEIEALYSNQLNFAKSLARPDTEIVLEFISHNMGEHFASPMRYPRAFMAVEMVERIRQAEADGYDAAFPGMCFGEFFLQDARQAVKMPVIGAAEASMMVAQMLGKRFGVLTTAAPFQYIIEENIRAHGWENAAVSRQPVRYWDMEDMSGKMLAAYAGRPEQLIEEFDSRAQELVRDGADVVICGCNPYGAALSQVGYNEVSGTGVPVVTAFASQVKMAEAMIDLKRSLGWAKSEAVLGPYRSTPSEVLEDMARHGIGMPEVRTTREPAAETRLHAA